jgi:hypothetical protein
MPSQQHESEQNSQNISFYQRTGVMWRMLQLIDGIVRIVGYFTILMIVVSIGGTR